MTTLRCAKGDLKLRITDSGDLAVGHVVEYGPATLQITELVGQEARAKIIKGVPPTRGDLTRKEYAMLPQEIIDATGDFWCRYWQRDDEEDQYTHHKWQNFINELATADLPEGLDVEIDRTSLEIWTTTIQKLKSHRAAGPCGWRPEELKLIPHSAVQDLILIFEQVWQEGFPHNMMQARVTLLAKNSEPRHCGDTRPITIMSTLCRLASKIIADQVLKIWSIRLPPTISGGLPRRGCRDLTLIQQILVERAHQHHQTLLGFVLDLEKAFNTFPRLPIAILLTRLGIKLADVTWWFTSLGRLERRPKIQGVTGAPIKSTTGVPEGDALSVISMIALSVLFHAKTKASGTLPACYADNWGWMSTNVRAYRRAMVQCLNLTQSIQATIDFKKSWAWSAKHNEKDLLKHIENLFPWRDKRIEIRVHAKELGTAMHYSTKLSLEDVQPRLDKAEKIATNLKRIDAPIEDKAQAINISIWPTALWGSEAQPIGAKHYQRLRRIAVDSIAGHRNFASPFLAMLLVSQRIIDPFVYQFSGLLRLIRRLAFENPALAEDFFEDLLNGDQKRHAGPAHTVRTYVATIEWTIQPSGMLKGPNGEEIDLKTTSNKKITKTICGAWEIQVHRHLESRKGIPPMPIDFQTTRRVFSRLNDIEQRITLLNLIGGYQPGQIKAKWAGEDHQLCQLCQRPDTRGHRLTECPCLSSIRQQHPEAMAALREHPHWVYLPLSSRSQEEEMMWMYGLMQVDEQPLEINKQMPWTFYTDGAASCPQHSGIRQASYAIVQANHDGYENLCDHNEQPWFQCLKATLLQGPQQVDRAELAALAQIILAAADAQHTGEVHCYSDSQHAIGAVQKLSAEEQWKTSHKAANWDILVALKQPLQNINLTLHKVKSHRKEDSAKNQQELLTIMGNNMADQAAGAVLKRQSSEVLLTQHEAQGHLLRRHRQLEAWFDYLVNQNRQRQKMIHEKDQEEMKNPTRGQTPGHNPIGYEAKIYLTRWIPQWHGHELPIPDLTDETAQAICGGTRLAAYVHAWARTLKWPSIDSQRRDPATIWGISWLELLANFLIVTGEKIPIPISNGRGKLTATFVQPETQEADVLPARLRAATQQTTTLIATAQTLSTLLGVNLLPWDRGRKATSLVRLGFKSTLTAGLSTRPIMLMQEQTLEEVWRYREWAEGALLRPMICGGYQSPLPSPRIAEPLDSEGTLRMNRYMRTQRQKTKGMAAGG